MAKEGYLLNHIDCTIVGDVYIDLCLQGNMKVGNILRGGTNYYKKAKTTFGGSGNIAAGLSYIGAKTICRKGRC